jgi:hypothetical protein
MCEKSSVLKLYHQDFLVCLEGPGDDLIKGTGARDFTALFFSSKVSILGSDSYPKFFQI